MANRAIGYTPEQLERLGRLMFGRPLRIQLAIWITEQVEPYFFQKEAALGVDYDPSNVGAELETFVALRMITKFPRETRSAPQYYSRVDSALWTVVLAVRQSAQSVPTRADSTPGGRPRRSRRLLHQG
jgi:hypothetical protein